MARRSACPATCSASTALASTRARALASSSRARSSAGLLVADLHLQALPGARLASDRAERLEGARLLLDLQGRGVAQRRQRLARLLADQPVRAAPSSRSIWRRAPPRGQQVLGLGQVGQPERPELLLEAGLGQAQLGFHLRATAQAPIDLDVAELPCILSAAPEPPGDGGQDKADRRDDATGRLDGDARIGDAQGFRGERGAGDHQAQDDQGDRPARQRLPGRGRRDLELDLDLAGERRLELADPLVHGAQPLDGPAEDRQRVWRRVGRGQAVDLGGDLDGLPVALVALARGGALGGDPLGLAGLLEEAPALGQRGLGIGPAVSGGRQRIAVLLELGQGQLALLQRGLGLGHGLVGDLEPARGCARPWSSGRAAPRRACGGPGSSRDRRR